MKTCKQSSSSRRSIYSLVGLAPALLVALTQAGIAQTIPTGLPNEITGQKPFHQVWDEEVR